MTKNQKVVFNYLQAKYAQDFLVALTIDRHMSSIERRTILKISTYDFFNFQLTKFVLFVARRTWIYLENT